MADQGENSVYGMVNILLPYPFGQSERLLLFIPVQAGIHVPYVRY